MTIIADRDGDEIELRLTRREAVSIREALALALEHWAAGLDGLDYAGMVERAGDIAAANEVERRLAEAEGVLADEEAARASDIGS